MTKVTPTVTNVTHANIDKQHKDLTHWVDTLYCVYCTDTQANICSN